MFFPPNRLKMLLYINKVDKILLLFSVSLLINLLFKYSKCLQVYLNIVFYYFLCVGLLYKDWQIRVLAILGGFMLYLYGI